MPSQRPHAAYPVGGRTGVVVRGFRKPMPASVIPLVAMMTWLIACAHDGTPNTPASPTPSFTLTAQPSPTPTMLATPSAMLSATPSATPSATLSATLSATPSATPSATLSATPSATPSATLATQPVAPLSSSGRWFIDAMGRVVMFHGVNMVEKQAPYYPAAYGFGDDDAAFLAAEGFNALRLGVDFRGLMPTPGVVEDAYIEHLAATVDALTRQQIFVLFDFHQDGFSPMFNGNGFPDWMAITDGLPNPPDAVFPLYYIQNPAMQRAFEHFWDNSAGPNGIGLQDYFVQGLERVAARFANNPLVLGTELINEPFPGATWQPCVTGCPDLEQQRLTPFYRKGTAAARALAPQQLVFCEPFVLFNFGQATTSLPGTDAGVALAVHSYALNQAGEEGVVVNAVEAAQRDQAPLLLTEFGATTDPVVLNRLTAERDGGLVPWLFWAYDGEVIGDMSQPAGLDNLRSPAAFDALVRPYPVAITGTPTTIAFDPTTRHFDLAYDTVGPGNARYASELVTVVSLPTRHYADGYTVTADGATVVSAPCAPRLLLRNQAGANTVSVQVVPAAGACRLVAGGSNEQ
jgi:endoglycosylceramidase